MFLLFYSKRPLSKPSFSASSLTRTDPFFAFAKGGEKKEPGFSPVVLLCYTGAWIYDFWKPDKEGASPVRDDENGERSSLWNWKGKGSSKVFRVLTEAFFVSKIEQATSQ